MSVRSRMKSDLATHEYNGNLYLCVPKEAVYVWSKQDHWEDWTMTVRNPDAFLAEMKEYEIRS